MNSWRCICALHVPSLPAQEQLISLVLRTKAFKILIWSRIRGNSVIYKLVSVYFTVVWQDVRVYVWSLSIVIVRRIDRNQIYNLQLLFTDGENSFINTFCSYSMIILRYLSCTYITKIRVFMPVLYVMTRCVHRCVIYRSGLRRHVLKMNIRQLIYLSL